MKLLDNKYKVLSVLGSGAFGKVFLAHNELANHKVAIKSFTNANFSNADITREIKFLASLNHPLIVRFYHHFFKDSVLHIVMEYCVNGNLFDYTFSRNKLDIDESVKLTLDCLEALNFIHKKNIAHRDIKPSNILLDENNKIKLSDFGVSNTHGGTTSYLPPEELLGESHSPNDPLVDIYSLGIVLIEMITGQNPFLLIPNKDVISVKLNHSFVPDKIPNWLQEVIIKATHPSPEFRFQSAQAFSLALKARSVPYSVNKSNIKADRLFTYAQKYLSQKKWNKSKNYFEEGFGITPDSVLGNIIAGKFYLKTYQLNFAKTHLEKAMKINPGVNIKKELAEIHLVEDNFPQAISLLHSHLQLNPLDWEAYNLLAEAYYRMDRFELSIDIFDSIKNDAKCDCIWNNLIIAHLCAGSLKKNMIKEAIAKVGSDHFIRFVHSVHTDKSHSWSSDSDKKNKFVYQSYRFNKLGKSNYIKIETQSKNYNFSQPLISIGRNQENDIVTSESTVSRRHCVIINYEKDVWVYDLGSTTGVYVDDEKVNTKRFLLGKHKITLGNFEFNIYTSEDALL